MSLIRRAPAHGVRATLAHGEAKGVDARRLLGPVGGGHASSGSSGHIVVFGGGVGSRLLFVDLSPKK
jgi:hypothetical protein